MASLTVSIVKGHVLVSNGSLWLMDGVDSVKLDNKSPAKVR
jgi:hypothetical protein